jgi:hypothetical protein
VPPDLSTDIILKKYAFSGVLAPKPAENDPSAVFPFANDPVVVTAAN